MQRALNWEELLLTASGMLAIAVVGWIAWVNTESWPLLLLHLLFTALFATSSLEIPTNAPDWYGTAAVLAMLALSVLILGLFPYQVSLILAVVVAASAPYHLSRAHSWLLVAAGNVVYGMIFVAKGLSAEAIPGLASLVALQGFAISSSLARRSDERSREALAIQNAELQAAREVIARQTQAEERLRIAGALHDTIGHRLTALQLQLEVLAHEAPPALQDQVATCKTVAADLLEEVRAIVRRMPATAVTDLREALAELADQTPGVTVEVCDALPPRSAALAEQLVLCCREAVHNAVRHGHADRIEVRWRGGRYEIDDNGRGLGGVAPEPGFGLRNMNARLAPFGGRAVLAEHPERQGCRLSLWLPEETAS